MHPVNTCHVLTHPTPINISITILPQDIAYAYASWINRHHATSDTYSMSSSHIIANKRHPGKTSHLPSLRTTSVFPRAQHTQSLATHKLQFCQLLFKFFQSTGTAQHNDIKSISQTDGNLINSSRNISKNSRTTRSSTTHTPGSSDNHNPTSKRTSENLLHQQLTTKSTLSHLSPWTQQQISSANSSHRP